MSESDIIKVLIDDTELDRALFKANQIIIKEGQITGGKTKLSSKKLWSDWRAFSDSFDAEDRKLMDDLPGINRDMRMLIGMVPGGREATRVYQRLNWVMDRYAAGATDGSFGGFYLAVAVTALMLLKQIQGMIRRMRMEQQQYEAWIRRSRNLTHDQYIDLQKEWQSYSRGRPG